MNTARRLAPVLWLLDFDGVVNAIIHSRPDRSVWPDWTSTTLTSTDGVTYPVTYSPTVVDFIARAAQAGVEVTWLSTWEQDTALFPEHLSLPPLPWLPCDPSPEAEDPTEVWGKHTAAQAHVDADSALVWTDDDLASGHRDTSAARQWGQRRARTHLEAPPPHLGLTPRMLRNISTFLNETCGVNVEPPAKRS